MRLLWLMVVAGISLSAPTANADSARAEAKFEAMLQRIDPSERLEQVCEYAALTKIARDRRTERPDRVVMESVSPAKIDGDNMSGTGAAMRAKGRWYQFEFACKAAPDRLKVESFSYRMGQAIPEGEWEKYGLWR